MNLMIPVGARLLALALFLGLLASGGGASAAAPYIQQANLTPAGAAQGDGVGQSLAISGDTAVVGDPGKESVLVYTRTAGVWAQQAVLTASDPAPQGFGSSVAVSGDTIAVGAPNRQIGANFNQGAAYVFTRTAGGWTQQAELLSSDGETRDFFGFVAVDGDTLAVGAFGWNNNQGKIYVFMRQGGAWSKQAEMVAADGSGRAGFNTEGDQFGAIISLSGDTLAAGTPLKIYDSNEDQGAAYIFARNGNTWTQQAELSVSPGPGTGSLYGDSVSISGDTVLIGCPNCTNSSRHLGEVLVFTRTASSWIQQAVLGVDGASEDGIGGAVAISGDWAVLGRADETVNGVFLQGSAYIFSRNGTTWTQEAKLLNSDAGVDDCFGSRVAIDSQTTVISAACRNRFQGAAYVFAPAPAPLSMTWVSGTGDDRNDCSRASPCASFAGAFIRTAPEGQINCADAGDYGPLTISRSLTIDCRAGTAGVQVSGVNGITVNVAAGESVVLRGLTIDGEASVGSPAAGVAMVGGGALTIDDCDIFGFRMVGFGFGVNITGLNGAHVLIENTLIRGNWMGVTATAASGSNSVTIDRSTIESNLNYNVFMQTGATAVLSASTIAGAPVALANNHGAIISYGNNFIRNFGAATQTLPRQ